MRRTEIDQSSEFEPATSWVLNDSLRSERFLNKIFNNVGHLVFPIVEIGIEALVLASQIRR